MSLGVSTRKVWHHCLTNISLGTPRIAGVSDRCKDLHNYNTCVEDYKNVYSVVLVARAVLQLYHRPSIIAMHVLYLNVLVAQSLDHVQHDSALPVQPSYAMRMELVP